ncbi:RNA polymerase sigma factor [Anaeroselena agilis]|uniref:Sigma-70 family RNA polymerase sigma factor n=1 Tax=Anaeroselena agilis TaxID=3063788 RepID=A0ABU3NXZ6_9FIRM|nr:sigma-70 family RNA polymerase sigma factor [Selenomonadales bacterium 4137-cl]
MKKSLPFDRVYAEYHSRIHRYLVRLVGTQEADDVAQETFIKVGQGLGALDSEASLSAWIYRIATNAATDRLRSKSFRQEAATVYGVDPDRGEGLPDAARPPSTEERLIRAEMNACIRSYVDFLPTNYRAVLVLSELEGFTNSEIAAILRISLGNVKIRLHRAKEKLRQELAANCTFYRTDCNQLACEPKGPVVKKVRPLKANRHP